MHIAERGDNQPRSKVFVFLALKRRSELLNEPIILNENVVTYEARNDIEATNLLKLIKDSEKVPTADRQRKIRNRVLNTVLARQATSPVQSCHCNEEYSSPTLAHSHAEKHCTLRYLIVAYE